MTANLGSGVPLAWNLGKKQQLIHQTNMEPPFIHAQNHMKLINAAPGVPIIAQRFLAGRLSRLMFPSKCRLPSHPPVSPKPS